MELTSDPFVIIEERGDNYVQYKNISNGRRWKVIGRCDRRGDCLIGSVVNGETIRDHAHLEEIKNKLGKDRIDSELDVPVTPEFKDCCPFTYEELENGD